MTAKSIAHMHNMNHIGLHLYPDKRVDWHPDSAPDLQAPYSATDPDRSTGRLRGCGYCGSMHPTDLVAALQAGAKVSWADQKYGWPHKVYVDGIPNPHAGMLESRGYSSHPKQEEIDAGKWVRYQTGFNQRSGAAEFGWRAAGEPAKATTHGKFYIVHLQDATLEEKDSIEQAVGLQFEFQADGRVGWRRYPQPEPSASVSA